MAFDESGKILVANVNSNRISRIDPDSGEISVFIGPERGVLGPDDITTDGAGTYWTTCASGIGGESVFRIDKSGGIRAIYAGITGANGIQFDKKTGRLFVGQYGGGNGLYEIDPNGRTRPRLITKDFASTNAMDFDREGNIILTVHGGRIAKVHPDSGKWTLFDVRFPHNSAVKVAPCGAMYVTGYENGCGILWRVSEDGKSMEAISCGSLPPLDNLLYSANHRIFVSSLRDAMVMEIKAHQTEPVVHKFSPPGLSSVNSIATSGETIFVSDGFSLHQLDKKSKKTTLTKGNFFERRGFPFPGCMRFGPTGTLYLASSYQFPFSSAFDARIYTVNKEDFSASPLNSGTYQGLSIPSGLWAEQDTIYVTEFLSGNLIALDGNDDETKRCIIGKMLLGPLGLARHGDLLFVAESLGQRISFVDLRTGRQDVLVCGRIGRPTALDIDPDGWLLVVDADGQRLIRVNPATGSISVIAEQLPVFPIVISHWPFLASANGLAVDRAGNIYIGGNDDGSVWQIAKK